MSIYSISHNLKIFEDHNTSLYKISQLINPQNTSILDVGCSSGYLGQYLKLHSKNINIDGIEIDAHDRKLAQKHLDSVKNIDIEKSSEIAKLTKKYQTIIFADVLEHTVNPKKILKDFTKKLNADGQILLSIPNITHQSIILELLSGQWNYENSGLLDKTHLHFFDYNEVIRLVEENGLFINKIDYSIFDLPVQQITKILNRVGIKKPDEFIKTLKKSQHKIFQFVVCATNTRPKNYKSYLNNQAPLKPISDWINEWEKIWEDYNRIQKSTDITKQLKNKINLLKNQNLDLKKRINRIESSKFYSLFTLYQKSKKILKSVNFPK